MIARIWTFMLLTCCVVRAAEPAMEKMDLFSAGTLGYEIFRIPGVIVTGKGTVLAYCEARKNGGERGP